MNRILIALFLVATVNAAAQTTVYSEDFQNGLPVSYTIVDNDMQTPDASTADFADAWIELAEHAHQRYQSVSAEDTLSI